MAKPKREGQILILMALLSTTLIILFGMVVSIGHLVQAKINLQNAVDLAAMTGASWQARYLNHISLINYRMRQNYKFILYDLYVTQSRFNKGFRDTVINSYSPGMYPFDRVPSGRLVFGVCQQMEGYMPQAPGESGEGTAEGTDMCRNVDDTQNYIPPITPSPIVSTNPILIAANEAIRALSRKAQGVCRNSASQNSAYFEYIMKHLDNRQSFQMDQLSKVLTAFSQGFGSDSGMLSPGKGEASDAIYRTFASNLLGANSNANLRYVNPERTRSINSSFTAGFQQMFDSRSPPSSEFTDYFEVLESFFRIKVTNITVDGAGGCKFSIEENQYPKGAGGRIGTFLGLGRSRNAQDAFKRPKIPFSVVLRAEVRPRLLFWPRGLTPTLVAVAAAKPFGDRVGPPKAQSDYEVSGGAGSRTTGGDNIYPLANMSYFPGDVENNDGTIPGVGHKKILGYLYSQLLNRTKGYNAYRPSIVMPANQDCMGGEPSFLCLALSPTLYEGLFWSVFPYRPEYVSGAPGRSVLLSMFPNEVGNILTATDSNYLMQDRMSAPAGDDANDRWHHTSDKLGDNPDFQWNGKPLFFADRNTTLSAWAPRPYEYEGKSYDGRLGYQIKLASIREICEDIEAGGTVPLADAMAGYCRGGSGYNRVTH